MLLSIEGNTYLHLGLLNVVTLLGPYTRSNPCRALLLCEIAWC